MFQLFFKETQWENLAPMTQQSWVASGNRVVTGQPWLPEHVPQTAPQGLWNEDHKSLAPWHKQQPDVPLHMTAFNGPTRIHEHSIYHGSSPLLWWCAGCGAPVPRGRSEGKHTLPTSVILGQTPSTPFPLRCVTVLSWVYAVSVKTEEQKNILKQVP